MQKKFRKDLTGKKFGSLVATGISKKIFDTKPRYRWNCICDCGKKTIVSSNQLTSGKTKSCGCQKLKSISGENNHKVKRMIEKHGVWIKASDPWYNNASRIISHAKTNNIPIGFESVVDFVLYLKSITPKQCPVFNMPLTHGIGTRHKWSPSVDKIIPSKGYVRGNIQVISNLANTMKLDASPKQLKQFSQWILKGTT